MKKINKILISLLFVLPVLSLNVKPVCPVSNSNIQESNRETKVTTKKNQQTTVEINNEEDLLKLIENCQIDSYSENKIFNINTDIDLKGKTIKPIAIFKGTLNGNNHTISNFKIDEKYSGNELSFIRKLTFEGVINDLNLKHDLETSNDKTILGGIVGTNEGTISNCSYKGKIQGSNYVGGIAGINKTSATIINSRNYSNVIGEIIVGGITGRNDGTISSCQNKGHVNNTRFSSSVELTVSNIGGIVGFNKGKIYDSKNTADVGMKQIGNFIGGIAGSSIGQVLSCSNYGTVSGKTYVGGIIGYYAEFILKENNDSYNELIDVIKGILNGIDNKDPSIKPGEETVEKVSLQYCYNKGQIIADNSVGGITGYASNDNIKNLGKNYFVVELCCNEGDICASATNAGGITGNHGIGEIKDCFNIGTLNSSQADYVGGICGISRDKISCCFSLNDIKGYDYVGGITGLATEINDCYSLSNIKSKGHFIGSIAGYIEEINSKVSNNFYVSETINGIDNIDYKDKAMRVLRTDLASKDNLNINIDNNHFYADTAELKYPSLKLIKDCEKSDETRILINEKMDEATRFGCYVSFMDENENIIKRIFVKYGDDLDESLIPDAPSKEGYFTIWTDFDKTDIKNDIYVKAYYKEIIRSIASNKGPSPEVIVEGKFYDTTKVSIEKKDNDILPSDSQYTYRGTYKLNIYDEINSLTLDKIKVKLRLPKNISDPAIATIKNGKLKIVDSYIDNNYICFDNNDLDEFILLEKEFANWNNPAFKNLVISLSVVIPVVVIGGSTLTVFLIKRKKAKKD